MTLYNNLNVKLSHSLLNKLKAAIRNETEVVLRLSPAILLMKLIFEITYYQLIDKLQILVKLLQIIYQLIWKTQLSKMIHSGGFLRRLFGPLLKTALRLMKNVIKPLAKNVLISLVLATAASIEEAGIHKKIISSVTTILITSNDETEDITKIVKSLEDSGLLLKVVNETNHNEAK